MIDRQSSCPLDLAVFSRASANWRYRTADRNSRPLTNRWLCRRLSFHLLLSTERSWWMHLITELFMKAGAEIAVLPWGSGKMMVFDGVSDTKLHWLFWGRASRLFRPQGSDGLLSCFSFEDIFEICDPSVWRTDQTGILRMPSTIGTVNWPTNNLV